MLARLSADPASSKPPEVKYLKLKAILDSFDNCRYQWVSYN